MPAIQNPEFISTNADEPELDLRFQRVIDVPKTQVWRAWTEPARLMPWFCPRPWKTIDCQIDLRPGGIFHTTMQSPEGQTFPNAGCYLVVQPNERLVWTNALLPGFRPAVVTQTCGSDAVNFLFTVEIELADHPEGTRYTAIARHADRQGCEQHAAMGFEQGWGIALDQMVAMIKGGD